MSKFEFQLAVTDEEDLPAVHGEAREPIELPVMTKPVHRRKKEGDIVNVTKHPSLGNGRKTIDAYLIVVVDVKADVALCNRTAFVCENCGIVTAWIKDSTWQYPLNGSGIHIVCEYIEVLSNNDWQTLNCIACSKDRFTISETRTSIGLREHFKQAGLVGGVNAFTFSSEDPSPDRVCKNRYSIKLDTLKVNPYMTELDYVKVRDKECIYQPFKTIEDVLLGKPEIAAMADCGVKPNDWNWVTWSDTEKIVWDNVLEQYIGPSDLGFKPEAK